MAGKLAVLASSPADYQRLGLSPASIAAWEDGARTDGSAGTYEWWYFDAHLADGAKLVVTFMNKDIAEPRKPLSPLLRVDLDLPGGRHFEKLVRYPPAQWSAARDHADVRLGENRFTGDLHRYRIQARAEEISVDVTLTGEVPRCARRPGTCCPAQTGRGSSPVPGPQPADQCLARAQFLNGLPEQLYSRIPSCCVPVAELAWRAAQAVGRGQQAAALSTTLTTTTMVSNVNGR